jgi:hypothetical protein
MRKKEKAKNEKLDEFINKMSKSVEDTDKELLAWKEDSVKLDFFMMIGRRVSKLSTSTQEWMEEEMWALYERAKRRDQQPGHSQENEPPQPSERNAFSFLQSSIHY